MRKCLAVLVMGCISALPSGSVDRARLADLDQKARSFAKQQDWKAMRDMLLQIGQEMPAPTPTYMLRMASVEALLGHKSDALEWLRRYAAAGLSYDIAQDQELKTLVEDKGFQELQAHMQRNLKPMLKAEPVCSLPIPDLMPEDLTFEPSSGSFVVSSIQHHSLYQAWLPKPGEKDCRLQAIPLEESARRWPVLAVSLDAKRGLLWMTTSAMPGFVGSPEADSGKAALLALNRTTGKVVRRFDLAADGPAVLGDMSLAEDGTVFVTDSLGGGVYRVQGPLASARLERIADGLSSPQTPVAAADHKRLFVADYSMGIAVIALTGKANREVEYLRHPDNIAVTGLDGLYLSGDYLLGIQNGSAPERIVRFRLNREQTEIISAEVIEQASTRMGEATHVISADGMFYVSANVGWDKVDDHGRLKAGKHFTKPVLLRFSAK